VIGRVPGPDPEELVRFAAPDDDACVQCGHAGVCSSCRRWDAQQQAMAIERLRAAVAAMDETISF